MSINFLKFVFAEGVLLFVCGIMMIIAPGVSSSAVATVLSSVLVGYGVYKTINSIMIRRQITHFWFGVVLGLSLICVGAYLFMNTYISLLFITSFIAIYLLLQSIDTTAFSFQSRRFLNFWWVNLISAVLQFLLGMLILLGLPVSAIWAVGLLLGINFLVAGMGLISMSISTRYAY